MSDINFDIYSKGTHKDHINKYEKCGDETIKFIKSLNPLIVLDLGCGNNLYKPFIPNLIGIDIANKNADINSDISKLNYGNNTVDVCIVFGSINFGTEDVIRTQLTEVHRILKPNAVAIFRGNESNEDPYYGWSNEKVNFWANEIGFNISYNPVVVQKLDIWGKPNVSSAVDRRSLNGKLRSNKRLYWRYSKINV